MNLPQAVKDSLDRMLRSAWVNMGLPFDVPTMDEKKGGIIDVEALLIVTFLLMEQDRMVTDLPAWIIRFRDLINHQKLKSLFKATPTKYRGVLVEKLNQVHFLAAPKSFRKVFGIQEPPTREVLESLEIRSSKLNSLEHVAQSSIMLKNRLLYGTGFRADVITVAQIKNHKMNGRELAALLCTNSSTASRILNDLRACQFLSRDNERVRLKDPYPGMFVSSQTIWNLCEIVDAEEFRSEELKKATYENLDFKHDRFGMVLLRRLG